MIVTEPCSRGSSHKWHPQRTSGHYCSNCGLVSFELDVVPYKSSPPSPHTKTKNPPKSEGRRSKIDQLIKRDGLQCFYCEIPLTHDVGESTVTLDHLIPRSLGGTNQLDNLVLACSPCNQKKHDSVFYLVAIIKSLRENRKQLTKQLNSLRVINEIQEWELFDLDALGYIPGKIEKQTKRPRLENRRPRPGFRDDALEHEVGARVFANIKSENIGNPGSRRMTIVKRCQVMKRPRKNVLHSRGKRL